MIDAAPSIFNEISKLENSGETAALCVIIQTQGAVPRRAGAKMLVYEDGRFVGTVGGGELENRVRAEAKDAMADGRPRKISYSMVEPTRGDPGVCGGTAEVYIEPILPKMKLLIIGAGHVGQKLAQLANWLEFDVIVSDDRVELCTPEACPGASIYLTVPMFEIPNHIKINNRTIIVLTTRGSDVDIEGLPDLLKYQSGYVGVIGSKRRWAITRKGLLEKGVSEAVVGSIHSPIGLEIHAETPEEIAVSIMAQIIMECNRASGQKM